MKIRAILFFLLIGSTVSAQFLNTATVSPNPLECSPFTIAVAGDLPATNYLVVGDNVTVSGSTITARINFDAPGFGLTIITPFSHTINVPANVAPSGSYTLIVEAYFTVQGMVTSNLSQSLTLGSCCPASADFTTNASNYCWNDTVFITDQSAGTNNIDWYVNGAFDHSGSGDFALTGLNGQVQITQYAVDPGCTDSTTQTVNIYPKPVVGFSSLQVGHQFNFTAGGSSAMTYTWDFGDGNTGSGALVAHTFDQDGSYNVCLTSTDGNGCAADSCLTVVYSTVGIQEQSTKLRMYPNPAVDMITVEGTIDAPIRWYNELGQEVYFPLHNGSQEYVHIFDLTNVPAGVYYIQWADQAEKVVIQ